MEKVSSPKSNAWQVALSNLITDVDNLIDLLELEPWRDLIQEKTYKPFPLRVTQSYVARMTKRNPNDPLLLQVLPQNSEFVDVAGFHADPLNEKAVNPIPGLLHKYPHRVLVTLTGACAVHCRYCFRRHFDYAHNTPGIQGFEKLFNYINADEAIHEVILSGGDPLAVTDKVLEQFVKQSQAIPHIKRLRIHTRMPVVLPERITQALLAVLQNTHLQTVLVIHANHPQEINTEVIDALLALKRADVHLFNQSVLLKNINDDVETLVTLSEVLFSAGVHPYYLHVLDKVAGAAHFALSQERIAELYQQLMASLPGYLVPKLVQEEPGKLSKTLWSMSLITD